MQAQSVRVSVVALAVMLCSCAPIRIVQFSGAVTSGGPIAIIGDTQRTSFWQFFSEQNDEERSRLMKAIAAENPAALIILGDLIFQGDSRSHWSQFDEYAAPIARKAIPVFPVLGNHEYFGDDHLALELYFGHFPHLRDQLWYSVVIDSVGFIFLNSNFNKLDDAQIAAQHSWYRAMLSRYDSDESVRAFVVACHHPPLTHSTVVDPDAAVRDQFLSPYLKTRKGAYFFSGHCHAYERFSMQGKHVIVSGGGGGPRQKLDPRQAADFVPVDHFNGGEIRPFHFGLLTRRAGDLMLEVRGFTSMREAIHPLDTVHFAIREN